MKQVLAYSWVCALMLGCGAVALAQQQLTPAQSAAMQLGSQLGLMMQSNADLATQIQVLNAQLAEKDKRIKELEAAMKTPEEKK